jgi:hypothetical protein
VRCKRSKQVTPEVPQGINIWCYSNAFPNQWYCGFISNKWGHRFLHSIPNIFRATVNVRFVGLAQNASEAGCEAGKTSNHLDRLDVLCNEFGIDKG